MSTSTRVTVTDQGMTVTQESSSWFIFQKEVSAHQASFAWCDVSSVLVFKRDLWTRDLICMVFELKDSQSIEIDEETVGWKEVLHKLPAVFPEIMDSRDWYGKVAFPAYATNSTQIYPPKISRK
jgi:hypothetical protein